MADLRLIVAAIGLAACGRAGAEPGPSGIAPPAGWRTMPELATAARDALGKTVKVAGSEAWGEPAMGCYGLWLDLRTGGGAEAIAGQVLAGLTAPGFAVRDVVKPTAANGVLALAFERAPYRGRLRTRIGGGKVVALACFANQREPIACESACNGLLGAVP